MPDTINQTTTERTETVTCGITWDQPDATPMTDLRSSQIYARSLGFEVDHFIIPPHAIPLLAESKEVRYAVLAGGGQMPSTDYRALCADLICRAIESALGVHKCSVNWTAPAGEVAAYCTAYGHPTIRIGIPYDH